MQRWSARRRPCAFRRAVLQGGGVFPELGAFIAVEIFFQSSISNLYRIRYSKSNVCGTLSQRNMKEAFIMQTNELLAEINDFLSDDDANTSDRYHAKQVKGD